MLYKSSDKCQKFVSCRCMNLHTSVQHSMTSAEVKCRHKVDEQPVEASNQANIKPKEEDVMKKREHLVLLLLRSDLCGCYKVT